MANRETTKYQHYVPQAYLRSFSFDGEHVYAYDLKRQTGEPKLIKKVCGENYFNDVTIGELKAFVEEFNIEIKLDNVTQAELSGEQVLERYFSEQIEGQLFNSIKNVLSYHDDNQIEYNKRIFNNEEKYCWALYSIYQFYRTKSFKDNLKAMLKKGNNDSLKIIEQYERVYGVDLSDNKNKIKQSSHDFEIRNTQRKMIMDFKHIKGMANIHYYGYKWLIGVATGTSEFLTSDNPCSFSARLTQWDSELYFPISNRLCFILKPIKDPLCLNLEDCSFMKCNDFLVDFINKVTISYADRMVVSKKPLNVLNYYNKVTYQQKMTLQSLITNPEGGCYIAIIDLKKQFPEEIIYYLKNKGFTQVGNEQIYNAPMIYLNNVTRTFRLGYFCTCYGKPIGNKYLSEEELKELF